MKLKIQIISNLLVRYCQKSCPDEEIAHKMISKIKENYNLFEGNLNEFSKNFVPNGAENSAKIASTNT